MNLFDTIARAAIHAKTEGLRPAHEFTTDLAVTEASIRKDLTDMVDTLVSMVRTSDPNLDAGRKLLLDTIFHVGGLD